MRSVFALYIDNPGKTVQEISELENVNTSTVYRDIAIATAKNVRLAGSTKLFVDHVISQIGASQPE